MRARNVNEIAKGSREMSSFKKVPEAFKGVAQQTFDNHFR